MVLFDRLKRLFSSREENPSESGNQPDPWAHLPIGVLICEPGPPPFAPTLTVTYWNDQASSLVGDLPQPVRPLPLATNPCLRHLADSIRTVLATGTPITLERYDPDTDRWLDFTISRHQQTGLIYIQNKSPEKYRNNLQRRLELESIISDISGSLLTMPPDGLNAFIHESLAKIGAYNNADRVYIFEYAPDNQRMSCTHEWCAEGIVSHRSDLQDIPTRSYPWWQEKMSSQQTIRLTLLDELPPDAASEKATLLHHNIQSLLVMPLVADHGLVGFVGFDAVREARQWDTNDADLLKTFSALVVTATSRASREQQLQRVNKRLTGLRHITKALLTSSLHDGQPDLTALHHLYEMIPCEIGIVFRIDEDGQYARTESRFRHGQREDWPGVSIPVQYLYNNMLAQGQEILVNQLRPGSSGFPADFNPYAWGHRSFLCVPLQAREQYVGLLVLLDPGPQFFTAEHVLIAKEVAGQLSVLLLQEEINQQLTSQATTLFNNHQLLQVVVDTSPTGLALLEPVWAAGSLIDFTYRLVNPVAAHITGQTQETMPGQRLLTMLPHVRTNGLFDCLVRVATTGASQRIQLQDDLSVGEFWGDYLLARVGGNVLLTVNDITSLKRAKAQLQQTNAELETRVAERTGQIQQLYAIQQAIFKYTGLAIAATDTEGIIQLVNPALETMTGYRADELIGKVTPGALRAPAVFQQQIDQLRAAVADPSITGEALIRAYLQKHDYLRRENTLLTKAGQLIPVISTVTGLYNDEQELIGYVDTAIDISYLKTIEQELVQANQRSQLATRAGKLGVWEWNLDTNKLILDGSFASLFDMPRDKPISHLDEVARMVHPDDLPFFKQYVADIQQSRKPFNAEFRLFSPTHQSVHYMKADGLVRQDDPNGTNRMIGVIRDRTTKRQAEQALRDSEYRYRSLVDHLKVVVFQADSTGCWLFLNAAWEEVTGFTVEEALGHRFLEYILPDDQAHTLALFSQIRDCDAGHVKLVVRYRHKEGGYRWIDVFAQATLNEQAEITGFTGTLTDITDRKKAEEAIIESEQRFRDIAENVDEIFWIRDLEEPRFTYMNAAYERFTGQPVTNLYRNPLTFLDFIIEEDRPNVLSFFMHTEQEPSFEFRANHQDGSIRYLSVRIFTVKDEAGVITRRVGVASDITSAHEKELILQDSLQRERALNALKSRFISTASHEFRTPLAGISSSLELVKHYVNSGSAPFDTSPINRHLDNIHRKIFSLNDLISDTLTVSKLDEGKVMIDIEPVDLFDLCTQTLKLYFSDRGDKRFVELIVIGEVVPVETDRKLIAHVLVNLLSNAFKFSTGNPTLTLRFKDNMVTLKVSDKGIGIPQKDIPNLFGKFFRASNAIAFQGTGLGLAICHEYITLLNGQIDLDSTEGVGTTFRITLPKAYRAIS